MCYTGTNAKTSKTKSPGTNYKVLFNIKYYMLQEGFGLSSSPILRRQGAGHDVISFEAWLRMRFVPKQAVQHEPSM